jgi:Ca-activated chloride channel family protein
MDRRVALRHLGMAGAGCFLPRLLGSPQEPREFVIKSDVRLVALDVSVKDKNGGLVGGLSRDNFKVLENGVPQKITVFADNDLPVSVGILVDESRSMTPKRVEVLAAAEAFIAESNTRDELFVLNFNDTVRPGLPAGIHFSSDAVQLRKALAHGIPEGKTALNDAVIEGLKRLEKGTRDKKALLLISDGGDNSSTHKAREVIDAIERSTATVYAVGIFDKGDPDRDPGLLKQLAHISGGESFFPDAVSEMTPVCRAIAKEIRTRYTIGYVPRERGGARRQVQVRVSAPGHSGLVAKSRTTYRYEESSG